MFITEIQSSLLSFANNITGGDPTAKGLVMVWLLATLTYIFKSVPLKIWELIKINSVIKITVTKDDDVKTGELFSFLEHWFIANNKLTLRNRSIQSDDLEEIQGFGYGTHLVFCYTRLFKIEKYRIEQAGSIKVIEKLTISTIGRNPEILTNIIAKSKIRDDVRYFWILRGDWGVFNPWKRISVLKPWPPLFIDSNIKKIINDKVMFFKNNREWYIKNNIPYKLTIVLHGEPGTGKTSLIRYISDLLESDLYNMALNRINPDSVQSSLLTCRKGIPAVIALEDFERAALSRETKKLEKDQDEERPNFALSEILNMLQGLNPIENIIMVLTTNHIEKVDPALLRKGRTDILLEVGRLGIKEVSAFYEHSYGIDFPETIKSIKPIKACDMEALFKDNPQSPEQFILDLTSNCLVSNNEVTYINSLNYLEKV